MYRSVAGLFLVFSAARARWHLQLCGTYTAGKHPEHRSASTFGWDTGAHYNPFHAWAIPVCINLFSSLWRRSCPWLYPKWAMKQSSGELIPVSLETNWRVYSGVYIGTNEPSTLKDKVHSYIFYKPIKLILISVLVCSLRHCTTVSYIYLFPPYTCCLKRETKIALGLMIIHLFK